MDLVVSSGTTQPSPGSSAAASASASSRFVAPGQGHLDQGPEAARHRVDRRQSFLGGRHAVSARCRGDRRCLLRIERPVERRRQEPGDRRAVPRILVEPGVLAVGHDERLDRSRLGVRRARAPRRRGQPGQVRDGHDVVDGAMDQQDRTRVSRDRRRSR